jgi:hypothetical protein
MLNKMFYGVSFKSLQILLFQFAERNKIAHNFNKATGTAGKDFIISFMKRHNLSLRTPRKTSVARTMGFNRQQINLFFDNLQAAYDKYKFSPNAIFNMDETGLQTVPAKLPKIVSDRGQKEVAKNVSAEQGQTVTVVCCLNASGGYIPPFFIYKRKRENALLIKDGPSGCQMAVTDKGYIDTPTFIKWLDHFAKHSNANKGAPALLILDNHASHVNFEAIQHAESLGVVMISLPPHSSHKTQPLDRVFFKPLKTSYNEVADSWQSSHPGQVLTVYHIAQLFKVAYERTATIEKATASFRATGIYPLDRGIFGDEDFLPSVVTDQSAEEYQGFEEAMVEFRDENFNASLEVPAVNQDECLEEDCILNFPADELSQENSEQNVLAPTRSTEVEEELSADGTTDDCSVPGPSGLHQASNVTLFTMSPAPNSNAPVVVSPADILPLPKQLTRRKRNRKSLKSTILTSTPNKKAVREKKDAADKLAQEKAKRKAEKEIKRKDKEQTMFNKRQSLIDKKNMKKPRRRLKFESSDSESCVSVTSGESNWHESGSESDKDMEAEWTVPPKKQINEYCVVKYEGKLFPGLIIGVSETHATVSAMAKCGRLWKWPERPDILDYEWERYVISGIAEPKKTSTTRNVFAVNELESYY